jgi:hypothetical protein
LIRILNNKHPFLQAQEGHRLKTLKIQILIKESKSLAFPSFVESALLKQCERGAVKKRV